MHRSSAFTILLRTGGIAAMLALMAGKAQAQATITGKVTDTEGKPIGGAQVVIRELASFGASTAANGVYTITIAEDRAKGQSMTLVARFLGKSPRIKPITLNAGRQEVDFVLKDDPLRLDELVVTGVNEATSTKKLPFAVGRVSADQIQDVPGTTALGALNGKVAGVHVETASGDPASAPTIRLRGATSIGSCSPGGMSGCKPAGPLIIIDGTISRASMADIASEDIDRIEVIKGAAASSLYGSDAANGVIQIFTKRGKSLADGKLLVTLRNEFGSSFVGHELPVSHSGAYQVNIATDGTVTFKNVKTDGSPTLTLDHVQDQPYPSYHDFQAEVLKPGLFYTNYLSVGQRRGSTNFNASFENTNTQGVIFGLKGFGRQNFRLNVDQQLTSRLDLELSSFYGHSDNHPLTDPGSPTSGTQQANQLGPFFGITFLPPYFDIFGTNPDGSPYTAKLPPGWTNVSNPLYSLANIQREQVRARFTGGGKVRWRMLDWLTGEANYNFDQETDSYNQLVPLGFLNSGGSASQGSLAKRDFSGRTYNAGTTLTATKNWKGINNTTKVSYVYEDQTAANNGLTAGGLIVKGVPEGTAANPTSIGINSNNQTIRNRNAFAITTFDIKDKYIVDGLIRRDESSLFGSNNRKSYFYRVSGAWRANEDLKIKGFDEIRLRASYGTAGLRPGFDYQYETLTPGGGSFFKTTLGNKNLKPAHSAELEVGGNVEMAGGRFTMEYTYSRKDTKDQIQLVPLPSVVGFGQQWQNVGALRSSTHEFGIGFQAINNKDMAWVINVVGDRTRQIITDYPLPERLNGFGQQPAVFKIAQGVSLGAMYGNKFVRTISELYADPAKAACRATTCPESNYVVNEEGYLVTKASWRCGEDGKYRDTGAACSSPERHLLYTECSTHAADGSCTATTSVVKIGDANPDFNTSFSSTFNYKRFSVYGLLDWSQGGNIYNGTRQWKMINGLDFVFDQAGKPNEQKKSIDYYGQLYNSLTPLQFFAEPGTYAKIKELSVNYTFVRNQLQKVGLGRLENVRLGFVGRNLFTFTKYSGYDPEVSGLDGDPYQFRIDWFAYPHFRTFTGVVEIAF
ncbi:MAG TPA: SusC/RagA family TonB-linked outer membrane protein [Gemmatimonadales bacterium]|nr:SusC/RagA family TonB-linked outer membrane protein [Gemmatimonadales bacterium]